MPIAPRAQQDADDRAASAARTGVVRTGRCGAVTPPASRCTWRGPLRAVGSVASSSHEGSMKWTPHRDGTWADEAAMGRLIGA